MSLSVQFERRPDAPVRVVLSGAIDERSRVKDVLARIQEDAILDLGRVRRVNSVGLIEWLRAIAPLTRRHRIQVEAISYGLAIQANQLTDLFGAAELRSCLAPYFCAACNANREVVVSVEEAKAALVPPKRCERCGGELEFDEIHEYFTFLREAP